ncbi:ADP-glucose phosphorylase [Nymphaea thermarum]|nr:ADP-glucose phosphorylase [Nymphaea thermarum]
MQEIRRDVVFNRSIIFSPARAKRPSDFKAHQKPGESAGNPARKSCAFCKHHEHECAPEIFRVPPDTIDWKIRVIENLYPALNRTLDLPNPNTDPNNGGGCELMLPGFGFHDVVIETPDHSVNLSDLSAKEIGDVLLAYKDRIGQLAKIESVKYVQFGGWHWSGPKCQVPDDAVMKKLAPNSGGAKLARKVFKNHGASAGASMSHSHSQLMGVPFVPSTVSARLDSAKENFCRTGKCLLCEIKTEELLVGESTHFFALVPFAASLPFEIWIIPRLHASHFEELDHEKATDLGGMLKLMLLKLSKQLNDPPFNYMIHTSPFQMSADSLPYAHWFIQIVPQLIGTAGFEMATGCYINPVFPEDAAKVLREVTILM